MTATQDRWLNSVNDFIAGFNKQLASDKNTYNSALAVSGPPQHATPASEAP